MSRELTASVGSALELANVPLVSFVELDFSSGFVRVTNAPYSISWNGHTWAGLGTLGGIDLIEEGASLASRGVALRLSGVPVDGEGDSENIAIALGEHYQGRDCRIWIGVLNDSFSVVSDPKMIFLGRMDNMEIVVGQVATITLMVESRLADLERPRILRYNSATQQKLFPGDLGLDHVEAMVEKALIWGRSF